MQFEDLSIPMLSQIPVLGPILFQNNILVHVALVLVLISAFVLFKTTFGLKIRAVGENPQTADSLGVNVYSVRYLCVVLGSALMGLAGGYVVLAYVPYLSYNIIAGRGWIAFALVYLGRWDPRKLLGGVILFSFVNAFQLRLESLGIPFPYQVFSMIPYILCLIVLVMAKGSSPSGNGPPLREGIEQVKGRTHSALTFKIVLIDLFSVKPKITNLIR